MRRGLAATIVIGAVLGWAFPAWAQPPTAYGWWWKGQPDQSVKVPPPPSVPSGGMYVASDISGPSAVAALRFVIDSSVVPEKVKLVTADVKGSPAFMMCVTAPTWTADLGGPYARAPVADCAGGKVAGSVAGSDVTFSVGGLVHGGQLSVIVLPAPDAAGANPIFQVAFAPPDPNTLTVVAAPPPPATSSETGSAPPAVAAPPGTGSTPAVASLPLSSAIQPPTGDAVSQAPDAPAAESLEVQSTPSNVAIAARNARPADTSRARALGALLIVLLAAYYARHSQAHERTPHLLGGPAARATAAGLPLTAETAFGPEEPVVRGIGRFAQPRQGEPPPL
jgi:hypothetical protein